MIAMWVNSLISTTFAFAMFSMVQLTLSRVKGQEQSGSMS